MRRGTQNANQITEGIIWKQLLLFFSNVIIQTALNHFGTDTVAADFTDNRGHYFQLSGYMAYHIIDVYYLLSV